MLPATLGDEPTPRDPSWPSGVLGSPLRLRRLGTWVAAVFALAVVLFTVWCASLMHRVRVLRADLKHCVSAMEEVQRWQGELQQALAGPFDPSAWAATVATIADELDAMRQGMPVVHQDQLRRLAQIAGLLSALRATLDRGADRAAIAAEVGELFNGLNAVVAGIRVVNRDISIALGREWRDLTLLAISSIVLAALSLVLVMVVLAGLTRLEWLRERATIDSLTGLLNRAAFVDLAEAEFERAVLRRESIGLLAVDLDDFKAVNDGLGHAAGDEVLVEVARRLRQSVRGYDVVCRFGGDEFLVLLPQCRDDVIREVADRVRRAFEPPMVLSGGTVSVTVCVGAAVSAGDDDFSRIVEVADAAMYTAKQAGGNRYAVAARPYAGVSRRPVIFDGR